MKKYLANTITSLRLIGSVALLFLKAFSFPFYITYLLCGISDMIDGTVAKKLNAVSSFGSKIDTAADFVFMVVCAVKWLPVMLLPLWLWIWIAVIAIMKGTNIILGLVRKKKFAVYHTPLNKATGLMLFLLPFTLHFIEPAYSLATVCAVATIAAIQEGYFAIRTKEFDGGIYA